MRLADSKIFRGDDSTLEPEKKPVQTRAKDICLRACRPTRNGTKAPILVIHDGPGQLKLVRNALDNLTISKDRNRKLPAFIAIAVENGGTMARTASAGSNTIRCPNRLARFIHGEVLPAVLNNAEIKSRIPEARPHG